MLLELLNCEILFLSLINCIDKINAWTNKTHLDKYIQLLGQIILLIQ